MTIPKRLFDLHCDTLTELYDRGEQWSDNTLQLKLKDTEELERYCQVFAVFSPNALTVEGAWERYLAVTDKVLPAVRRALGPHKKAVLSVENATLLGDSTKRFDRLVSDGVRILTPLWGGENALGGAHDTECGLTPFGYRILEKCMGNGVTPDVSHASDEAFWQICELCRDAAKPFIASHSDSRVVCPHSRNLTDAMFRAVRDAGGIVGINLYAPHLCGGERATLNDAADHILHFCKLDGEETVAFGCDLDGIPHPPADFSGIGSLFSLADILHKRGLSRRTIEGIFFGNAQRFAEHNGWFR